MSSFIKFYFDYIMCIYFLKGKQNLKIDIHHIYFKNVKRHEI